MLGNRGRDTSPELRVRSLVHRRGLRYRVDQRPIPGVRRTADLVFRPTRVAVFVDGCFWHRCPDHGTLPKNNHQWWSEKLCANTERDARTTATLKAEGWNVIRIWEHEPVNEAVDSVAAAVAARR